MTDTDMGVDALTRRHNFSEDAVMTLVRAVRIGGGGAAQFSHQELGGMGQWSRGGMIMIGDMFNIALRDRVARLCEDIADALENGLLVPAGEPSISAASPASGSWWPEELGRPASSGAQNDMRYAFFPQARRLAIHRAGATELYDTGEHRLSGFSQAQSAGQILAFTSQHGPVDTASLRKLGEPSPAGAAHVASATERTVGADPFTGLERLAELHSKGVVTTEEFAAKKRDLLARI